MLATLYRRGTLSNHAVFPPAGKYSAQPPLAGNHFRRGPRHERPTDDRRTYKGEARAAWQPHPRSGYTTSMQTVGAELDRTQEVKTCGTVSGPSP